MVEKFKSENWKIRYLGLSTVLLVAVLVYNKWFLTNSIFGWGDWGFHFTETAREWFSWPSVWASSGLGSVDISLFMYLPVRVFESLLSHYFDFNYFDKIVFLYPSVIISAVGAFLLVKSVLKNTTAAIIGSFVYLFNTYILLINTGHFTVSVAFGIGIFVFLFYQKTLETKKYFWAILTGLVAFLQTSYEPRSFYLTAWILLLYFVYFLWKENQLSPKSITKNVLLSMIPVVMTILLNSFWLIALYTNTSLFSGVVAGRQLYGEGHFIIQRAFTMFHPFWTGSHRWIGADPQFIFWWFWLIPFVAFMGFWFNKKNGQVVFWTIISLLGIFLTKFTSQPFTGVYLWLYQHLPGFNVFRESSKFNYLVDLGYAVLIASFITTIMNANMCKWFKWLLTIGITSLFLINAIPVFTGDLGKLLTPRNIPNDYLILKKFIQKQPDFFRTLYFPGSSRWGYLDSTHPSVSTSGLIQSDWREINNYIKTGLEFSPLEELTDILNTSKSNDLLDQSSIKYVIVPTLDLENEEMFIYSREVPREKAIKFLDQLPYLKKIDIGTSDLVVYENYQVKPHLYLNINTQIQAFQKAPSQFDFALTNLNTENKLFFSESFSSGWKLRLGEFSWWKSLIDKNYFESNEKHLKSNYGLNEYVLGNLPKETKVTLYFTPQAWVNIGSIISLSTLFISIISLWVFRNK
jgi:hypothetical protein